MLNAIRTRLLLAAVLGVAPLALQGTVSGGRCDCCCRICLYPCGHCVCPAAPAPVQPAVVPQTTYQPVYDTQYARQPVLQERDVVVTEYRNEPVSDLVPSTVYENVTVDEGSYQSVWVPRLTTKTVARTVYQTRTSYRTVPYQATRRISEYAYTTLPYQTVRYVPTTSTLLGYAAPVSPGVVATSPVPAARALFAAPASVQSGSSSLAAGPVPDPKFAAGAATPIAPRTAFHDDRPATSPSSGPLFAPAPSAAQAWRTARNGALR